MFSLFEKISGDRKGWHKVSDLAVGMEIAVPTKSALSLHSSDDDDILWDEIVSIKYVGREQVWDIEVEGTHNFVGNDIFAHNTYLLRADPHTGVISMNGNVGIDLASGSMPMEKLEVAGNVLAQGFITDSAADIAENYTTADSSITAGDVVQLDGTGNLIKSNKDHGSVLGVISTTPGLLLGGQSTATKLPVALAGRVPVKVTNENGYIYPGDRLTSSATKPGYAMKATEAGMTLGIALEPFSPTASSASPQGHPVGAQDDPVVSEGKVMVFINLGWQAGTLATNGTLGGSVASGSASPLVANLAPNGATLTDILATIVNSVMVKFQNIWASGDVIVQGIKKTYFAVVDVLPNIDITNWGSREITVSNTADNTTKALFTGSAVQPADQSKVDLTNNGQSLSTYGVDSTRGEIQLSGSSNLVSGEARVFFDYSFSSIISGAVPIRVMVTPTTPMQGQLYVATKTQYGFVVKGSNPADNGQFDWLVIARRKGYDGDTPIQGHPVILPSATPSPEISTTPVPSNTPSESPVITPSTDTPTPTPSDTPIITSTPSDTSTPSTAPMVTPIPSTAPVDTSVPSPTP